jgi:hypothetical protein
MTLAAQVSDMDAEDEQFRAERHVSERLAWAQQADTAVPALETALALALAEASAARSCLAEARRTVDTLTQAMVSGANRNSELEHTNAMLVAENYTLTQGMVSGANRNSELEHTNAMLVAENCSLRRQASAAESVAAEATRQQGAGSSLAEARRTVETLVQTVVFSANRNSELERKNTNLMCDNQRLKDQARAAENVAAEATRAASEFRDQLDQARAAENVAAEATREASELREQLARLFNSGRVVLVSV